MAGGANSRADDPSSALLRAAEEGGLETFKLLYNKPGVNKQVTDEHEMTSLMLAAFMGHVDIVKFLLEQPETDVNVRDKCGWTSLRHACRRRNNLAALTSLWNHPKFDRAAVCDGGMNALMLASWMGSLDMVSFLLSHSEVDINAADNDGDTALLYAARSHDVEIFKTIFNHPGVDRTVVNNQGLNAVFLAARDGYDTTLDFLLQQKDTDVTLIGRDLGATVLHAAAADGDVRKVEALWNHPGVNRKAKMNNGMNALITAVSNDHTDVVRFLLEQPDVLSELNHTDAYGQTALYHAVIPDDMESFTLLFRHPCIRRDTRDINGINLLMVAANVNNVQLVKFLLKEPDTDVTAVDHDGCTALHAASAAGSLQAVKLLVKHPGVNKDAVDKFGQSALDMAVDWGDKKVVKFLGGELNEDESSEDESDEDESDEESVTSSIDTKDSVTSSRTDGSTNQGNTLLEGMQNAGVTAEKRSGNKAEQESSRPLVTVFTRGPTGGPTAISTASPSTFLFDVDSIPHEYLPGLIQALEDRRRGTSSQTSPSAPCPPIVGSCRPFRSLSLPGPSSSKPLACARSIGKRQYESDSDSPDDADFDYDEPATPKTRAEAFSDDEAEVQVKRQRLCENGEQGHVTDGVASRTRSKDMAAASKVERTAEATPSRPDGEAASDTDGPASSTRGKSASAATRETTTPERDTEATPPDAGSPAGRTRSKGGGGGGAAAARARHARAMVSRAVQVFPNSPSFTPGAVQQNRFLGSVG